MDIDTTTRASYDEEKIIHDIYGKIAFLKIKPAFALDKILFSFVQRKQNTENVFQPQEETLQGKVKASIDCYMSITDARLFAAKITSGRIGKAMELSLNNAKSQNTQYPDAAWTSRLGGKVTYKDGEKITISRHFSITPGTQKYGVIQAVEQPAEEKVFEDGKKLYVPIKNAKKEQIKRIYIPVENYDELEAMAWAIKDACTAYSIQKLCNM